MSKREEHKVRIHTRSSLYQLQNGICPYCNKSIPYEKASLDHIIPVILTEENLGNENIIMCCRSCNKLKGDQIIFTNLFDKIIYPIVDHKYFYQARYIQYNKKDLK